MAFNQDIGELELDPIFSPGQTGHAQEEESRHVDWRFHDEWN
jgi:hypothetical protein